MNTFWMFMLLFYKSRKIFTFLVFSPSSRTFEGQHSSEYNRNKTLALRLILSKRRKTINKTNKEENTYCNLTQGEQKEWGGALNAEKERVDNSENSLPDQATETPGWIKWAFYCFVAAFCVCLVSWSLCVFLCSSVY